MYSLSTNLTRLTEDKCIFNIWRQEYAFKQNLCIFIKEKWDNTVAMHLSDHCN